ncbi:MAG: tetratricopeptide repeat protein [Cyclobacteriaceae bacterium]|nr:tetratricopeptide repeat protein [Cyclobacteriaceae bacterium]
MRTNTIAIALVISLTTLGCKENNPELAAAEAAEVYSLLGLEYYAPTELNPKLDSNLSVAKKNFDSNPSEENYIWLGRRTAYLSRYNKAIAIFSEGLEKYPNSYRLYRHRGHRYISQRKFDAAISDLEKAVELMKDLPLEIEPDGQPNKLNKPLSSTQFNVWYHLGLAYYLKGDFENAEQAYLECLKVSDNDDLITATVDWLYMTYRRQGKVDAATKLLEKITDSMTIIENDSYFKRLNLYKGLLPVDSVLSVNASNEDVDLALATQGYGVGNWHLCQGDTAQAIQIYERVIGGKHFSAFGFIAAEADLARLQK